MQGRMPEPRQLVRARTTRTRATEYGEKLEAETEAMLISACREDTGKISS